MAEFAQLQDNSVLQGTNVASKASGHEAMSQIFNMVSGKSFQAAESIQKEQSSSALMNANAQTSKISSEAIMQMKMNPSQAEQIAKDTRANFETVKQAKMSSSDRSKLNYIVDGANNTLNMHSAEIGIRQNRMQNGMNFYSAYNENMSDLSNALMSGDEKGAEILIESIKQNATNAAMDQLITPQAAMKVNQSIAMLYDRAQQMHEMIGSTDNTAHDINKSSYNAFSGNDENISSSPANHGTAVLANHAKTNFDDTAMNNQILEGKVTPELMQYEMNKASPEKWNLFINKWKGSIDAHSNIQSNTPITDIDKRINELNNKSTLSTSEGTELQVYQNYKKNYETGDFLSVINNTSMGAQATERWNEEKAAANSFVSYELSPEAAAMVKQGMLAKADNNYMENIVSTAQGMHMDPNKIHAILPNIMNDVQSSFNMDGDPGLALNQISKLSPNLYGNLSNQLKDPAQRESVYALSLGYYNNMKPEFQKNFIMANQAGQDYSRLKTGGEVSDNTITAQIKSNLPLIMSQLTAAGGNNSAQRVQGFTKSALNYIKFKTLISGENLDSSNVDKYIDEFSEQIGSAYNLSNRWHGAFNMSQVSNLSTAEQDMVQTYAINEATKNFAGNNEDSIETRAGLSKTDMTVYMDKNNHLVVKDQANNTLYNEPYSEQLKNSAIHYHHPYDPTQDQIDELQQWASMRSSAFEGF